MKAISITSLGLFITLSLLGLSDQVRGQCDTDVPEPMVLFDLEMYQGEWALQAYTPSIVEMVVEPQFRCNVQSFQPTDDPHLFNITNDFIRSNGSTWRGENQARVDNLTTPAVWTLEANGLSFSVILIDTDYTSWSLMFGCGVFNGFPVKIAMVHSREREMDPELRQYVNSLVVEQGFLQEYQLNINQTDCSLRDPWADLNL